METAELGMTPAQRLVYDLHEEFLGEKIGEQEAATEQQKEAVEKCLHNFCGWR
jgi:hypothetical protein